MAAAALFLPSAGALSKRLSRHVKFLANRVMTHRHRSVEIVLAFMVNVPWMAPGDKLGDDDTCSYIAMALTVALDLSLNKIVTPSSSFDRDLLYRLARADCIDAKRALHMDGFDDIDPHSEWGRRLLRRRERTWIALFVVERGYVFFPQYYGLSNITLVSALLEGEAILFLQRHSSKTAIHGIDLTLRIDEMGQ